MMDETRINELIDIFKELAELAGGYEETKIMPNLEVIDASPADLPANFIIISDDEGFYVPAVKAAGLTVSNGDFVNVLFIKGTEPIAFQHGSDSGGGGSASSAKNFQLYNLGVPVEYTTLATANAAAASGNTILVYPGAYTSNDISLVAGCNLIVLDPDNTTFSTSTGQYCLRVGAGSYVYGVRATVTTSHATQVAAIYVTGNNAILENCTGIGSNSHASGFGYGIYQQGATGVELRNCYGDATGTTGASNYGYRKDTTSGGTCTIIGGKYLGDASSIYNDQTGDVTLVDPILGSYDAGSSGGGIKEGYYFDTDGNHRSLLRDTYIASDEAGQKERNVDLFYGSITDHFDGTTFTGYTWAAYTGFGTPDNIDLSIASHVLFYNNNGTAATRYFAYKAATTETITARCYPTLEARAGIRFDDGSNNNYVELYLEAQAFLTPAMLLCYRTQAAGPTTLITFPAVEEMVLEIDDQGPNAVFFIKRNQGVRQAVGYTGLTFTKSRSGLVFENTTTGGGPDRAGVFDWYKQ